MTSGLWPPPARGGAKFVRARAAVGPRAADPCRASRRPLVAILCVTLLGASSLPRPAAADAAGEDAGPVSFGLKRVLHDTGRYFTAPLRWDRSDWLYFGGTLVAIGAAHSFDSRVRAHFTAGSPNALDRKATYSVQDALPAAAAVFVTGAYATLIHSESGRAETWSMLEAGALASATGYALKFVAGRQRPNETADPNRWRQNGASFPSLHASAAFAIGTVLAESGNDRYRWIRRVLGYGIATATGYERLKHNAHWLSDVVAGAALGIASGRFALNREYGSPSAARWQLVPTDRGVLLTYTVPLR